MQRELINAASEFLGGVALGGFALGALGLQAVETFERDGRDLVGLALGQEEIPGVTALDLDDIRLGSQALDVFGEDDF